MPAKTPEYHARRFLESEDQTSILARYADSRRYRNHEQLVRHICHVCAWVAYFPDHVGIYPGRLGSDTEPLVRLLTQLFRLRPLYGCGELTARLKASFKLVLPRIVEALRKDGSACGYWEELLQSVPSLYRSMVAKRVRRHVTRGEQQEASTGDKEEESQTQSQQQPLPQQQKKKTKNKNSKTRETRQCSLDVAPSTLAIVDVACDDGIFHSRVVVSDSQTSNILVGFSAQDGSARDEVSSFTAKPMKKLRLQIQRFESATVGEKIDWVGLLECEARSATDNLDAAEILRLLLKGAAWLAAPWARANVKGGPLAPEGAFEGIKTQTRLRRVLLELLGSLDATDESTRSAVLCPCAHIAQLLSNFERRLEIADAKSSKQWRNVKHLIAQFGGPGQNILGQGETTQQLSENGCEHPVDIISPQDHALDDVVAHCLIGDYLTFRNAGGRYTGALKTVRFIRWEGPARDEFMTWDLDASAIRRYRLAQVSDAVHHGPSFSRDKWPTTLEESKVLSAAIAAIETDSMGKFEGEQPRSLKRKHMIDKRDRAQIRDTYEPNVRVKELSTVAYRSDEPKALELKNAHTQSLQVGTSSILERA
eukprot:CAMPEP_0204174556 /NCGR_PEP_ID=MMETSP0361-20130328/45977_1 /ASSEMBLY_ACC=CAM_ASM_000343 /TAXON_ID=268821 /ORGANISM="Scrippsiella Hangoei, Strain SHTV-5" /LENGTH=593 /DNA_ID=CAMNT_0051133043 /DNA_START=31 /DNA_END=1813 /DNA_ORIENTATION=+